MTKVGLIQILEAAPDDADFLVWDAQSGLWKQAQFIFKRSPRLGTVSCMIEPEQPLGPPVVPLE